MKPAIVPILAWHVAFGAPSSSAFRPPRNSMAAPRGGTRRGRPAAPPPSSRRPSTMIVAARRRPPLAARDDDHGGVGGRGGGDGSIAAAACLAAVAALYWTWLVFGAAAAQAGLPVPDFVPLTPGWPPSDADLRPALEDSAHFFYIRDALDAIEGVEDPATQPPAVRLAVFNVAEAWVFAFLPPLLADERRLPLPAVLFAWLGGLGLTNAFLAPYLALREGFAAFGGADADDDASKGGVAGGRNAALSAGAGAAATLVAVRACLSCLLDVPPGGWSDFAALATQDRTYLAFCVDLALFAAFQPLLLGRVHGQATSDPMPTIYNVPFVGLLAWLFGK